MKQKFQLKDIYDWILLGGIIILIGQIIILGYINLTQLKYHIGFDASGNYLKAIEIGKQGTFFTENFADQTTLYLDSSASLAGILYSLTGNIFLSYGIINYLIVLGILWVFYSILTSLELQNIIKVACLNLILCPYLEPEFLAGEYNNLDYFCSMLSDAQFYGGKMLIVLMTLKMVLDYETGRKNYIFVAATEILLFISGISGGWYLLVTIVIPLITYYLIKVLIHNSWKQIQNVKIWLLVVGGGLITLGKIVATHVLHFESKDSSMSLIGLDDFWDNIFSIFLGFFKLFSAFPIESKQSVFEVAGIVHLLGLVVSCVYIIGLTVIILNVFKNSNISDKWGIFIHCAAFNILMFIVVNVKDGATIFPVRYLIPVFLFMTVLVGAFIEGLNSSLLLKKYGLILVLIVLFMLDFYGDRKYIRNRHDYDTLCEVIDEVETLNVPVVYAYGKDMKLASRALGVIDNARIYKYVYKNCFNFTTHWGDYTYYDDVAEVTGENVLISNPEEFEEMPEYLKNQYQFCKQIGRYYIYYAEKNKFDFLSGPVENYCIDFPISHGINVIGGKVDDNGSVLSDGSSINVIEGPFTDIEAGIYDFTVNYEILKSAGETAKFGICVNYNEDILGEIILSKDFNTATIRNVEIKEKNRGFGYSVYNGENTIIRVDSFEIRKTD